MDQSCGINVEAESEPEDGEILDENEEEEEEEERAPSSSRRRGHSRRGRERRHYGHLQDFRRRDQHHHQKYNNRSERSGGISRTLEYVRYLKSFTERNKSISAKRSSLPEERSLGKRKSRSRSPSPRHSDRNDHHRPRREIKSYTERCERKSKSRSSSSTVSREETCQDDVANGLGDIDVEEVSADEMQAITPSPVSSVEIVQKVCSTKTPEIITLDSTDTSDEENRNLVESKTAVQTTAEDRLISNANNPEVESDVTNLEGTGVEIVERPSGIVPSSVSVLLDLDTKTYEDEFVNVNPSNLQTLAVDEEIHHGYTAEEVELGEHMGEEEIPNDYTVEVVVLGGNIPEGEQIDRTNADEILDGNMMEEDILDRNIVDDQVFDGNSAEDEDLEQSHLSEEEIETLVMRNKLLTYLVNKTDSTPLASPSSPMAQFSHPEKDPENTMKHLDDENVGLQKNVDNDEEEALRAVLLSLYQSTSNKSKPTEPLCDNNVKTTKPTVIEDSSSKPKPVAKRRSTDDERRSSINRRRTSNPNSNLSSRSRQHSPPRRKPLPAYRRSSVGNRRYSSDHRRSRSRERSRKSPIRGRDVDDRKTSKSATVVSPPLSNTSSEHASLSTPTVKQTLLSRSSYQKNDSPIVNIKELSKNDLRVQLLKHSGHQKKTPIGLTSPNSDPVAPVCMKFNQKASQIENEVQGVTITRTVNFANNGHKNVTTLSPLRDSWDHLTANVSSNSSLPQVQCQEIPNHFQNTFPSLLSVTGQPLQRTVFAASPVFPKYLPSAPAGLEQSLTHLQPTKIRPSVTSMSVDVSNSCRNLTESPDLQHTGMKLGGNPLRKPRRRCRKKAKVLPKPNRWDQLPNSTETSETGVNIPTLSAKSAPSISTGPLKGTAKLNIIKPVSTPKPTPITPVVESPLRKTAVVNQANILTNGKITPEQMRVSNPLQKSSPYSSPIHSPTINTKTTNRHFMAQTFSEAKQIKPVIVLVRENDSTSDETEEPEDEEHVKPEEKEHDKSEEEEDMETPTFKGDINTAGNGQTLGKEFEKSLDEFLKRSRDEAERKANEILAQGIIKENTDNLEVREDTETDTSTPVTIPSPSSSANIVNESSNAASEIQVNNPTTLPETSRPSEDRSEDTLLSKPLPSEARLKELSNPAPSATNHANAASELSKVQHSGPSPVKKRRLLKSNLNNTKAKPTADSVTPVEVTEVSVPTIPTQNKKAVNSVATSKNIHIQTVKTDHQSMPRKELTQRSRPTSAEILKKQNTTAIATPKSTGNVNGIINIGKSAPPLELTLKASSTKKSTPSNSGSSSDKIAVTIVPGQPSPSYSKQIIDDLTKKIIESRDQLALSSKEKELLHCRQSCVDGLRDIYKGLMQHTRLSMMDSKFQSEIAAAEKHLQELRKKQLDVRIKASTINKAIKEKSKLVLPTKANCITLEREVKKLGDKIIGDRFYKVTDLFTKDIDSVVKDITVLHSRQPTNLKLERGVIFHQVISDIDPTSTLAKRNVNVIQNQGPPAVPPTLVATKAPARPQRKLDAKTKSADNGLNNSGTSGKETKAKNDVLGQQISHGKNTVLKKTMKSDQEIRFLTRHGRGSVTEEETTTESVSQKDHENDVAGTESGDVFDVLTDIKSSGATVERITDMEIPILIQSGAFTMRLDPNVQLCSESLMNDVCLKTDCQFQHI